ncbi:MAG: tetratricopeptide repeat protein [Polyangiaceae bacterium]
MVRSSPVAAEAVPPRNWLDRLSAILRLAGDRGVMVLVRGGPPRLGDLVRKVIEIAPDADVLVRADAMANLPPHSTVVVCLRRQDFEWLNISRPVVRGHRVILFGDAETTLALEREAFDFFDWISHKIDAPEGPPAFAVRALRSAACARANVIAWKGGDLDATFREALPGRTLRYVSAAQPYADLVEAMRPKPHDWVAITDLVEEFRVRRARWAAAEAGRLSRTILVESGLDTLIVTNAHALPMPIEEAHTRLVSAGIVRGARVAALLDLEPFALEAAEQIARAGMNDAVVEGASPTLMNRARPPKGRADTRLPNWASRIADAFRRGDHEVATHWAASWKEREPQNAEPAAVLAYLSWGQDRLPEAESLLEEARRLAGQSPSDSTEFALRRAEAFIRADKGDLEGALSSVEKALRVLQRAGGTQDDLDEIYLARFRLLQQLGRPKEADKTLANWPSLSLDKPKINPAALIAVAASKLAGGAPDAAADLLQATLDRLEMKNHPNRGPLVQLLVQAMLAQHRYADAERLSREAILAEEQQGRRSSALKHEHARALFGLGRFAEAERQLREVLPNARPGVDRAFTLNELARCSTQQGRAEDAERLIDEAISEMKVVDANHPGMATLLHEKATLRRRQGDPQTAVVLLRQVLMVEERTLGSEHPTLIVTLNSLAMSLLEASAHKEAERLLRRALRLAERVNDHLRVARTLTNLALVQAHSRLPQAADTARRAQAAWETIGDSEALISREELHRIATGTWAPA